MPLALTIIECFRRADKPVAVLRFDGIGKRGESARPGYGRAGNPQTAFRFSQGVADIQAARRFLTKEGGYRPHRLVVVSFSASSIETRRAIAIDGSVAGWICVAGSADLQSMMKN